MDPRKHARQPRYLRQIVLPGFGEAAQRRLAAARVAVVGAGGLGAPVLTYLAAAGVGAITVVDDDVVDVTNLHRQVIHPTTAVGTPKVDSARDSLHAANPLVHVTTHRTRLTPDTVHLLTGHDVVVDASDNFPTRLLIDDTCAALGVPMVWGALLGFDGQVSVFDGDIRYRDAFPAPPEDAPTCETAGVIGPAAGMIGTTMALEVIKLVTGVGRPLIGRLLVLDGLATRWREIPLRGHGTTGSPAPSRTTAPQPPAAPEGDGATARAALALLRDEAGPTVVDLRPPQDIRARPLPRSVALPVTEVLARTHGLDPGGRYLFVCEVGRRSRLAVEMLRQDGFTGVGHVPGGVAALLDVLADEPWPWP